MSGSWVVLKKELRGFLLSPLAYVLLAVILGLGGYFFAIFLLITGVASMNGFFSNMGVVLIFIAPVLTMRLLAEEQQRGTMELLMTTPISITQVVLGKFFAAVVVFALALVISLIYVLILLNFGKPEIGPIMTSYLGFLLLGATYLAVGLFASSLTDSQMVAGVVGFGILLVFWVVGWVAGTIPGVAGQVAGAISILDHNSDFIKGVVDTTHIVYYLSMIVAFLYLTVRMVERRTWA